MFKNINLSSCINRVHHFNENHILIFGRYPLPGKTKTRLIPALGALGAAQCHRELTEKTVNTARQFECNQRLELYKNRYVAKHNSDSNRAKHSFRSELVSIRFCYDGGTKKQFKKWLGSDDSHNNMPEIDFHGQADGDLGHRMREAITNSFDKGASRVVLVGTDIPHLSTKHFKSAFNSLNTHDLVLGPSMDGGYWLVGIKNSVLKTSVAGIFDNIEWSTEHVLYQTLAAAEKLNLKVCQLDLLNDLDTPEDLKAYHKGAANIHENRASIDADGKSDQDTTEKIPVISIIIPTLNEAESIGNTVDSARHPNCEIIVVDGGSHDNTISIAKKKGVTKIVTGIKGRAAQQNLGAEFARGEFLLFLHADTWLPPDYAEHVFRAFLDRHCIAGAFEFSTDSVKPLMKLVSVGVNIRSRWLNMPYGDQALFFRQSVFKKAGAFPKSPIAEDLLLVKKVLMDNVTKRGKLAILPVCITTSARRWNSIGIVRTTIINLVILFGILIGVPSERLAGLYGTNNR